MSDLYMYTCISMLPLEIFLKLDALRLLLGPFWDRSRATVAIHGSRSIYCIQFLAVHAYTFAIPADFEHPREKVLRLTKIAGGMTSLEGQLVNSRAPKIAIYLHTYLYVSFHRSGVDSLHAYSIAGLLWTNASHSSRLAARLVDHFQMVEDLKCTVKWCIQNLLEAKRVVRVNPLEPPCLRACIGILVQYSHSYLQQQNMLCTARHDYRCLCLDLGHWTRTVYSGNAPSVLKGGNLSGHSTFNLRGSSIPAMYNRHVPCLSVYLLKK